MESTASCVVSQGTRLDGNFSSPENIRLDGKVFGAVSCDKKLVVGAEGLVEGEIKAAEAVIMGQVSGNILVKGTLHLLASATVQGDLNAGVLIVDEGAKYDGKCRIAGKSK